jgi:ribosomal protein L37AE/L43A
MHISEDFQERLQSRFDGRYRVRWSPSRHEFHLEQKVARGLAEGFVPIVSKSAEDRRLHEDERIRARDGFMLTMIITAGDRMPCEHCGSELQVPLFASGVVTCQFCAMRGKGVHYTVGYFPLNDVLLEHLEKIDVLKDGDSRVMESVRAGNVKSACGRPPDHGFRHGLRA